MISETTLHVLFVIAAVASYLVLTSREEEQLMLRLVGGVFTVLLWSVAAFWATSYVRVTMCCEIPTSSTSLSLLGAVGAVVVLLDVLLVAMNQIAGR